MQHRARRLQVADLFGESDEEKAQRSAHSTNRRRIPRSPRSISAWAILRIRCAAHRARSRRSIIVWRTERTIDRMQKDFDYRLCALSAQQLGAAADRRDHASRLPCGAAGRQTGCQQPGNSAAPQRAGGDAVHLTPPPGSGHAAGGRRARPQADAPSNQWHLCEHAAAVRSGDEPARQGAI